MSRGPRAFLAAAIVLTVGLVAAPFASTATAETNPLDLAGRYGCDDGGRFVEVTIGDPTPGASYQVGMLPPGRTAPAPDASADAVPDAVTAPDAHPITVRLAQPAEAAGDAYVSVVATGEVGVVVLPHHCKRAKPRVPQLPPPGVAARVASGHDCAARPVTANQVAILTSVHVSARPTRSYRSASGLAAIFYNLALVDVAAGRVVDSSAVSFANPGTGTTCLAALSGQGTYQVQVIGTDGTSTATNLVQVQGARPGQPGPPPTPNPPPSPPTPRAGATGTPAPVPTRSAPTRPSATQPGGSSGVQAPGTAAGGAASSTGGTGQRGLGGSDHQHAGVGATSSGAVPVPNDSGVEAFRRLAEPPADAFSTIFVWQSWAALIVLGFALVTGALIAITVRQSRRR